MAKDGTNRGNIAGNFTGAGRKPKPLAEKIAEGRTYGAKIMQVPENFEFEPEIFDADGTDDAEIADFNGEDMPPPSEYLSARQKDGTPLGAAELYTETWRWLKARGCDRFVNPRLIEAYAQAFTRYIQCEDAISMYGFLGKHPTTGGAIASPFVSMSQSFQKQANLLWYEIFDIVRQNCTTAFVGNPQDDIMEALLSSRRGP